MSDRNGYIRTIYGTHTHTDDDDNDDDDDDDTLIFYSIDVCRMYPRVFFSSTIPLKCKVDFGVKLVSETSR